MVLQNLRVGIVLMAGFKLSRRVALRPMKTYVLR